MFDSGVGGLTVLHECLVSLPEEDFVYLGDTRLVPLRDQRPERAARADPRDRRAAARRRRGQAAGDRLQHGDLDRRGRRPRGRRPSTGWRWCRWSSRRPRSPRRSPTAAGSACWRRRTRSRAAPTAGRSKAQGRALEVTEVEAPGPGAVHPGRLALRRGRAGDGARLLRAAEAGRGRHPDPRLHPLPAGRADAAAHPRPRRAPGQRRPRGRRRGPAHAGVAPASTARRDGEGDYRFLCTGDADSFRELGTRFLQMPLGEVERVELLRRDSPYP